MAGIYARPTRTPHRTSLIAPSGVALDLTDIKVLRLLAEDAGRSVQDLAARINLSHSAASQRVRRLEMSGVIVGRIALIDDQVFEPWLLFSIDITLTPIGRKNRDALFRDIEISPEILEALETVGDHDLQLKAALPSPGCWAPLQNRLDPAASLIDKARLRAIGRTIKRSALHPLLTGRSHSDSSAK